MKSYQVAGAIVRPLPPFFYFPFRWRCAKALAATDFVLLLVLQLRSRLDAFFATRALVFLHPAINLTSFGSDILPLCGIEAKKNICCIL